VYTSHHRSSALRRWEFAATLGDTRFGNLRAASETRPTSPGPNWSANAKAQLIAEGVLPAVDECEPPRK
jgi:hypothetical protein